MAWQSTPDMPKPKRVGIPFNGYACDQFTNAAIEWLEKREGNQPFFMELALTIPHPELYAPQEAVKRYLDDKGKSIFNEKPYNGSHYGGQTMPKAAYAAMVSKADDYIGKIIQTLKAKGFDKNTLVIFTSDNGTHIEGGRTMEDVQLMKSAGQLRGVKRDLYEGGIRVPTIAWGIDLPKGVERNGQGAFWDLLPTFLHITGIKHEGSFDGISLYNHWKNGEKLPERALYWEFYEGVFAQAIRLGDWKYIQSQVKDKPVKVELFNLKDDISETTNVADKNPKQVAAMQDLLKKLRSVPENPVFKRPNE
jgi:arylsulfatase A-like enzyme